LRSCKIKVDSRKGEVGDRVGRVKFAKVAGDSGDSGVAGEQA
jgi:hypothetical protein